MASTARSCITVSVLAAVLLPLSTLSQFPGSNGSSKPWNHSEVDYMETGSLPAYPIVSAPASPAVTNELCRNDSKLFLEALQNGDMWAVEMFDSSAKFPSGFFSGATYILGSFDECLSVGAVSEAGDATLRGFRGKYCLAKFTVSDSKVQEAGNDAFAKIKHTVETPLYFGLNSVRLASCIPSSCSASDLEAHLNHTIPNLEQLESFGIPVHDVEVRVEDIDCSTHSDARGLSAGEVAMLVVIATIVGVAILGMTIDFVTEKRSATIKGIAKEMLLCFSLRRNLKELMNVTSNRSDLDPIPAVKVIFMVEIIFFHRVLFTYIGSSNKLKYYLEEFNHFQFAFFFNTNIILEGFFIMSGYLFMYILKKEPARMKSATSMLWTFVRRYLRLTPVYMFTVGLISTLAERSGSGPIWNSVVTTESQRCTDNWWLNALYLNNIINVERMCLFVSWYLAVDMQLYIISLPVVYLIIHKPKIGNPILGILLFTSVGIQVFVFWYHQLNVFDKDWPKFITELLENEYFQNIHISTCMRGIPFFMGLCTGQYVHYFRTNNLQMSKMCANFLHVVVIILPFIGPLLGTVFFNDGNRSIGLTEAVFAPLLQFFRCLAVVGVIYIFAVEKEWYIMKILRWRIFKPLSRLTYTAYLIHSLLQVHDIASVRIAQDFSAFNVLQLGVADCVFTFLLALVLSMLLEVPVLNLINIFSKNNGSKLKVKAVAVDSRESLPAMDILNIRL